LAETLVDRRSRELGPEGLVRQALALVCADPSRVDPAVVEAHVRLTRERMQLGRQNTRAFVQASRSIGLRMANPRFWARVAAVTAPTLVVHGSLDRLIPVSASRELVRRRPDWQLEVLDGVGHVPMMETPDLFRDALTSWGPYRIATAGDWTLRTQYDWMRRIGYRPYVAGLAFNVMYSEVMLKPLLDTLLEINRKTTARVSLVGHSRGGVLAKVLSHRKPDLVEQVIALGSPLGDPFDVHPLTMAGVPAAPLLNAFRDRHERSVQMRFV